MGKMIIILISLVLTVSIAHAQEPFTINGLVTDSSGARLPNATIRILTERDSILLLSGADGAFTVEMTNRKFLIQVTMKGFNPYHQHISVPDDSKQFPISIVMATEYQELQSVTVLHYTPFTIKPDTLEYHARAYSMREGSMLADLMKKLPGVRMSIDSNVFVMGKKISRVMVDGKPFFSGDIQNALRNLPYDIIENVEVIDDYGDQARLTGVKSGEPNKVLNIVLKPDRKNGQFGNLEAAQGSFGQYTATGAVNALAGDRNLALVGGLTENNPFGSEYSRFLRINYADRWSPTWLASGEGSLLSDDKTLQNSSILDSYYNGGNIHQQQDNNNNIKSQRQELNYEWLYSPDPNNKLRINASYSRQYSHEKNEIKLSSTAIDSGFRKTIQSTMLNQLINQTSSAESKINFEQIFPNSGQRFSAEAGIKYSFSLQTGDNQNNIQTKMDSLSNQTLEHYLVDNGNTIWELGTDLHYYWPLGTKSFLETGYNIHQTSTQSNRLWQQPDSSGNWNLVDSLSNDFNLRTRIQDFRIAYAHQDAKTDLDLALIAEPGSLNGKSPDKGVIRPYHYFNFLPLGSFTYSLGREQKLRLAYKKSIDLPGLQQLQPVTDLSHPEYPVTGNPWLKPATSRSLNLNYDKHFMKQTGYWGLEVGIGYTAIKNIITANLVHPKDSTSVVQQTFFENTNGNYSLALSLRVDLPELFQKHLKISEWGTISETHNISMTDYTPLMATTLNINQNMNLQYSIPHLIEVNAYFIYDHTLTRNEGVRVPPPTASSITWGMNNHHYLFNNWILSYQFTQALNSGAGQALVNGATFVGLSLERSFVQKRKLTVAIYVVNATNANAGNAQTVTANPTAIMQSHLNFVGRSLFVSLKWKFERFPTKLTR